MRLGIYSDLAYKRDGTVISTHQAFITFVLALHPRVDELVVFGRIDPTPGRSHYEFPSTGVRFVPLPHYGSVTAVGQQLRAVRRTVETFASEANKLDAFWVFGPHPMSLVLALAACRCRVPLFLGVRQDYPEYIKGRLPSRRWRWSIPVAHALDRAFRALARRAPTVTVGDALAARYRHPGGAAVLSTRFSLIREEDIASFEDAIARPWEEPVRVLCVGRLAPEKNPLLLADVATLLRARGGQWKFVVVGDGPSEAALTERVAGAGVADMFELLGYVPSGARLWELYRSAHAVLHVSLTEGVPQVLSEAQAAGVPTVATDVGGVRQAVGDDGALLIAPRDAAAAADALEALRDDPCLRADLIRRGIDRAGEDALEKNIARLADFFEAGTVEWHHRHER